MPAFLMTNCLLRQRCMNCNCRNCTHSVAISMYFASLKLSYKVSPIVFPCARLYPEYNEKFNCEKIFDSLIQVDYRLIYKNLYLFQHNIDVLFRKLEFYNSIGFVHAKVYGAIDDKKYGVRCLECDEAKCRSFLLKEWFAPVFELEETSVLKVCNVHYCQNIYTSEVSWIEVPNIIDEVEEVISEMKNFEQMNILSEDTFYEMLAMLYEIFIERRRNYQNETFYEWFNAMEQHGQLFLLDYVRGRGIKFKYLM